MSPPVFDLKLRLALRVAAIAALCCVAAVGYVLFAADRSAHLHSGRIADLIAKDLALQLDQRQWITGMPDRFPDLQRVSAALAGPGLCIAYRATDGAIEQQLCTGATADELRAPQLFAAFFHAVFGSRFEASLPLAFRGAPHGEAVTWIDPQIIIAQSWRETSSLVAVMACALFGLWVLTYAALANALRPTRTIRGGIERLSAGDLSARLPPFDLAELSAIGEVFNHLAGTLESTLAERNALTRRLIVVQDDERQHLARELHDEFGQCLAAISAMAASAGETARLDCPALLSECQSISRTAAHMMAALRGALLRLRPPDVDQLGLAASLEGLVAGWNARGGGRTRYSINLSGDVDVLPKEFAGNLYRVAQEAITNAAKHAKASRVTLYLSVQEHADWRAGASVELVVVDDGNGAFDPTGTAGMGLLGMRERVAMLGGTLSFEHSEPSGLRLRAKIPVPQASLMSTVTRKAA